LAKNFDARLQPRRGQIFTG